MKKTQRKHLLKTVKKQAVTFFAVAFIAAVSIAIFHGFQSAAVAILDRADNYFKENNLQTLEIACANGITGEDLQEIASWEGVTAVEGGYVSSVRMKLENECISLQARSLTAGMNRPEVLEGRLPERADELAVEELLAERKGVQVGDVIRLEHDGELVKDQFTVVGIINEPAFCTVNVKDARGKATVGLGSNDFYMELLPEAFDAGYYKDCFTVAYVDSTELDGHYYFSEDYAAAEKAYIDSLEASAQQRAALRYEELRTEVDGELTDAGQELTDAKAELADAQLEVKDGEQELADARESILDGLDMLGVSTDFDKALVELKDLGPVGEPLMEAIAEYRDGEQKLSDARAELADAEKELARAETELSEAREEAADIREEEWVISGRNDMGDVRGIQTIVDMLTGLSYAMSIVFLLVAMVICYASASKMINEQRTLIGAQKALGVSPAEILKHFMCYNLLCGGLGVVLGWILGVVVVENLVIFVFTVEFLLGKIPLRFCLWSALLAGGICLAIFIVATYVTCAKLSKLPAISLLRGEEPGYGKARFFESWGVYKRMNLYSRTMIKNVLNDKGRMLVTIMGVVGCTSLMVSCMSLKMGIENGSIRHFEEYFLYDHRLIVDTEAGETEDFEEVLKAQGLSYTLVHDKMENFRVNGGNWENSHLIAIGDKDAVEDFIYIEDIETKERLKAPDDGLLVSRRAAERFGLEAGSTVEIMDEKGVAREFRIAGVMEHYLTYHLFLTGESYYEEVMGKETDNCVFLLKGDVTGLLEQVSGMPGFLSLSDNSAYANNADVHNMVIAICTALSAALAVLVLLNQITMYINRKARELAVMRVNGYTTRQTKAYVYKDNIVLTLVGLLLGCVLGVALGYLDIRIIETGACRYVRDPNLIACGLSCLIGGVFALIVNVVALKRIDKLNLTNVSSN